MADRLPMPAVLVAWVGDPALLTITTAATAPVGAGPAVGGDRGVRGRLARRGHGAGDGPAGVGAPALGRRWRFLRVVPIAVVAVLVRPAPRRVPTAPAEPRVPVDRGARCRWRRWPYSRR